MQSFVVIGLGQFGRQVAITLTQAGHEVLAIDTDMDAVEAIKDLVGRAIRADATREEVMKSFGIENADTAIVGLGEEDFEAAVLSVSVLKQMGVRRIVARSSNRQRGLILSRVGADHIVFPEVEMAERLARTLSSPGLREELALPSGHALAEVQVPAALVGRSLADAGIRQQYSLNVLAVRSSADGKPGDSQTPSPATLLKAGDLLIVAGERAQIEEFARRQ